VKRALLAVISLTASIFAAGYVGQEASLGEKMVGHNKHVEDLAAAAQIKVFPPAASKRGTEYLHTIIEADLLSLHVCQGIHQLFVNESRLSTTTSGAADNSYVDAQGAAECVVELQSALREVPTTHSAYSQIGTELAWWNDKLLKFDPADYSRLNP
jgi:hypothetical protein